jgi:hypothetical protein
MYRVAIFPVILFALISLNLRIWTRYGINYETIFEFPSINNTKGSFMLFSLALYMLVFTSMLIYILSVGYDALGVPGLGSSWLHPIVLFIVLVGWFLLPTERFFGSVRFWILDTLYRCMMAPMYSVTFRDLWLADQLTSMGDVLFELQFIMCIYPAHFIEQVRSFCSSSRSIGMPVLNMLPFWCRFWQCIRAYRDTKSTYHLVNAGKYLSSIIPICLAFAERMTITDDLHWNKWRIWWLLANLISTVYKYAWDIIRDWGLFSNIRDTKNVLLRNQLLMEPIWYYIAIVTNLVLRCSWLIVLLLRSNITMGPSAVEWISWLVILLELFRRFIWNIFRVELEHINTANKEVRIQEGIKVV